MNEILRDNLQTLSEGVHDVDLAQRVHQGARRAAVQRTTLGITAIAAVLAIGSVGAFKLTGSDSLPTPPGDPSPSATAPVDTTPSPTVSSSPTATLDSLTGTAFFFEEKGKTLSVYGVSGAAVQTLAAIDTAGATCPAQSISVSPDGTRVAWIAGGAGDGMSGELYVQKIGETKRQLLAVDLRCLGRSALIWAGPVMAGI